MGLVAAVAVGACDDDDAGPETTTSSGSGGTGGVGTAGGGFGGVGGAGGEQLLLCTALCTEIFECGLEVHDGSQLCPGLASGDLDLWLWGDDGCMGACLAAGPVASLPGLSDCASDIDTLKGAWGGFACVCEHGIGAPECEGSGGAGGGGGQGGAAGAGGG